jgi:ATP-dependent RNA helicase DDX41
MASTSSNPPPAAGSSSSSAMPAPPVFVSHRRRQQEAEAGADDDAAEDEAYTPYVPLAQRREARFQQLASRGGKEAQTLLDSEALRLEAEAELARKRDKQRRERTLLDNAQEVKRRKAEEDARKTADELRREEEDKLLKELQGQQRKLAGNQELAQGVEYTEVMKATWRPPAYVRARTEEEHDAIREKLGFQVEGEDVPPPAPDFQVRPPRARDGRSPGEFFCVLTAPPQHARLQDMKLPPPLLKYLKAKKILKPTPIQVQGIPTAFSGRDMIGIAFTGSGKTLAFSLPAIMLALEEEGKMPFEKGEGPVAMIVCPSRELARQTYEGLLAMCACLHEAGYPDLGVLLTIGGISMAEQAAVLNKGLHIVVATPGRLIDLLSKKKFTLDACKCVVSAWVSERSASPVPLLMRVLACAAFRYLCLDEADRMIDMGFEENVREIMSYFKVRRASRLPAWATC